MKVRADLTMAEFVDIFFKFPSQKHFYNEIFKIKLFKTIRI